MPRAIPLHILRARADRLQRDLAHLEEAHAASQQRVLALQEPLPSEADDQLTSLEAQLLLHQQDEERIQGQMTVLQRRLDDALRLDGEMDRLLAGQGQTPQA